MKNLNLGHNELVNIRDTYKKYYETEIESRQKAEETIIEYYNKQG